MKTFTVPPYTRFEHYSVERLISMVCCALGYSKKMTAKTLMLFFCVGLFLYSCSEELPPEVDTNIVDTTSHSMNWEYYFFGSRPLGSDKIKDIHVVSDTNIWMVGSIDVDTTILTTPHGKAVKQINTIHWDGEMFTPFAMEGVKMGGGEHTVNMHAVVGRDDAIYLISGLSCTEIYNNNVVLHDLQVLAGKWWNNERAEITRFGSFYIHGGPGFLAKVNQDVPHGKMYINQIQLQTEIPVAGMTEAAPDDLYIGCRGTQSAETHFYRSDGGNLIEYKFSKSGEYSRTFCTALWSSEDRIFAVCAPFLYSQSIKDTSDRSFTNMLIDLKKSSIGLPNHMTGRGNNDIFIVGEGSTVIHYNGRSFKEYQEIKDRIQIADLTDVEVTDKHVYIVGSGLVDGMPRAVLVVGTAR